MQGSGASSELETGVKLQSRIDPASDEHLPSGVVLRGAVERELRPARADHPCATSGFVPDHELLQRVGTGAYGEVWMARNKLGTLRAVKLVYRARFRG
jgi:hypothetical protein